MSVTFTRFLRKRGPIMSISVPKEIIDVNGWAPGTELIVTIEVKEHVTQ